jgi:hypothetical protein
MGSVIFTSASGWVLVVLLTATIALPYLIRSRMFACCATIRTAGGDL